MGTRYDDQPPEHWAGPESLDPTPVWKQYIVVGVALLLGIALILVIGFFALAPQFATPPALVAGNRLVLSTNHPSGVSIRHYGEPLVRDEDAFFMVWIQEDEHIAVRDRWIAPNGEVCRIYEVRHDFRHGPSIPPAFTTGESCGEFRFHRDGRSAGNYRGLDRYLVSTAEDRVIVNMSRVIDAVEVVSPPPSPR